jgi:RNA polymerase sigma-70 factor, ECF subfamily
VVSETTDAGVMAAPVEVSVPSRASELFEAHHSRLYAVARRMSRTPDEARDLVQDTFVRVAGNPVSVPVNCDSEEAWLVRVLVNVCRDRWRKQAWRRRLEAKHLNETRPVSVASPESAVIAEALVWQALQELSPRPRAAVILYELDGLTMTDVARQLGVAQMTARWYVSRGRKELGRIIAAWERKS